MAIVSCAELKEGLNLKCIRNLSKKYIQKIILINVGDIDRNASVLGDINNCDYTIQLVLKQGKKGVLFELPDSSNSIKGFYAKSKSDNGFVEYLHQVQMLMVGANKETKCKLDQLDHGRYVVAVQLVDGTIEIYGWENGVSTGDYTFDLAEGGGGSVIVLQSDEDAKESMLPLVYKSKSVGSEIADFDKLFENA